MSLVLKVLGIMLFCFFSLAFMVNNIFYPINIILGIAVVAITYSLLNYVMRKFIKDKNNKNNENV